LNFQNNADGLGDFESLAGYPERLINRGQVGFAELYIHGGTCNLNDSSDVLCHMNPLSDVRLLSSCRAADDLDNFFGDLGLTHTIHLQREAVNHV